MFISPMLLEEQEEPFDDDRYLFEPKIDGHRMIVSLMNGKVQMYTKHNNICTGQYPELFHVPVKPGCDVVLDGEVGYMNPDTGLFEFDTLLERFKQRKGPKILEGRLKWPVRYFVFDILHADGADVRGLPFVERMALLDDILTENEYYKKIIRVNGRGKVLFEAIQQLNLEGIVAKRKDSLYASGQTAGWMKIMNYQYENVPIVGYRKKHFALLGQVTDQPEGRIELAMPAVLRRSFHSTAKGMITGEDRNYIYMEPQIRACIRYRSKNKNGLPRAPEFVDLIIKAE
ncbi:ATP-dependent DNA ligase [Paenibacillus spongiae]|uniref:ATP-dependent DNA ligase n=1 Tax=Paenibacillus spongiae TaxID=2909671 RepID=A0ABY5S3X9_9BACL|nr:ATP-dependent DNA ligase [Paenibacillus spongiae]UVI28601.1 ATP-dependent DNA ligase [Paenibacillus spongiae]